ncbi:13370_t:CDS:1, partial [Acaulospora colombiana]
HKTEFQDLIRGVITHSMIQLAESIIKDKTLVIEAIKTATQQF